MGLAARIALVARESGPIGLVKRVTASVYRHRIRPRLPIAGAVRYGGVPVAIEPQRRWGDGAVPATWTPEEARDVPDYEAALLVGLRRHVRAGDRVTVVGGGVGVTATFAAMQAGPAGRVVCYEGGAEGAEVVRRTAALNGVTERLEVRHAVVARALSVYGTGPYGDVVPPADLEACDVLELDCEGAEAEILREMTIRPRAVLVETHGLYGATTDLVAGLLRGLGYRVDDLGVAEPRLRAQCEQYDIRVLEAVLNAPADA
jgi:hypothetical protein